MSTINSQADFDALLQTGTSTYLDTSPTVIATTDAIVALPGHVLETPALQCITIGADITLDNCVVNFTGRGAGGNNSDDRRWNAGTWRMSNAFFTVTPEDVQNFETPGFQVTDQANRPVYIWNDTAINYTPISSNIDNTLTNHFGNMALSGCNLTNLAINAGAFFPPIGATPLIGLSFSSDAVNDAGVSSGRQCYTRPSKATGAGSPPDITATFTGFYGCDMSRWVRSDANMVSINLRPDNWNPASGATIDGNNTGTTILIFLVDNLQSSETMTGGWVIESGGSTINATVVTGIPCNMGSRDDVTLVPIRDIVRDYGTLNSVWVASDDGDITANIPTELLSGATGGYITDYDGSVRRPGFLIETDRTTANRGGGPTAVDPPQQGETIADINEWSYTHQCFDSTGAVFKRTTKVPTIIGEMQYSQTDADWDFVSRASEASLLNGNNLLQGLALTTARVLDNLDDLYSAIKARVYTDRATIVSYAALGSKLSMGTSNWQFYNGATMSVFPNATLVNSTDNLSGGSIFDGLIGNDLLISATRVFSNMSLEFTTVRMNNNLTFGTGVSLIGGTFSGVSAVMSDLIFAEQPVFQLTNGVTYIFNNDIGDFTLNLASGAATVNITGSTLTPTLTGGGTITIPVVATTTTFVVPAGLPTGRAILKIRSTSSNDFLFDGAHTEGVKTVLAVVDNVVGSTVKYDMYFKPTNVYGPDGIFYLTTVLNGDIDSISTREVAITHVEHPNVLTEAAETVSTTAVAAMNNVTGTQGTILISGATDVISAPATQRILMEVTDEFDYLRLMANRQQLVDLIYPGSNDGTVVDVRGVGLTSLASNGQMRLTAVSIAGTGTLSGQITTDTAITAVLIADNPAGITGPQVENAIRPLTDSIENRVADVADHMEIDLSGIDPKDAYNPDTDYKT